MPNLTFCGETYAVNHAVKGADYIHGYDANGVCIVAFEDVADLTAIGYDGTFMAPGDCAEEACNKVVYCGGKLKTLGGSAVEISQTYTGTIPASGWEVYSNGQAIQSITVPGLLKTDHPIIDVDLSNAPNVTASIELEEEWSKIVRAFVQAANTLRFHAKEAPIIDIPIKMVVIRK